MMLLWDHVMWLVDMELGIKLNSDTYEFFCWLITKDGVVILYVESDFIS